jgi:cadmium resistance protein CadD (predicted permease)
VFVLLVGAWCTAGRYVTRHPNVAGLAQRWGRVTHPTVPIIIGVTVLVSRHTFGL